MTKIQLNKYILNRSWPFILIVLAGLSLFLFQNYKTFEFGPYVDGHFVEGHHGFLSSHGIALAKNLTQKDSPFLFMFNKKQINEDGAVSYEAYNQFPVFPFLLIGLAIKPFEPDLIMQVFIARQLMNLFFLLAMILCFLMVDELINNKTWASIVSLLSFSSYYMLYYGDMIFNDIPALFGFLLAFYVMVKIYKKNSKPKLAQIIILPLITACMGWQPLFVYFTWLLVDGISKVLDHQKIKEIFRGPYFSFSLSGIFWASIILASQIVNELRVTGSSIQSISLIQSMLFRLGFSTTNVYSKLMPYLNWRGFFEIQLMRITKILAPYGNIIKFPPFENRSEMTSEKLIELIIWCLFIGIIILSGTVSSRGKQVGQKALLALLISGFIWAIPMKTFTAFHEFQSIFYVGIPIALYIIIGFYISPTSSKLISIFVLMIFVSGIYQMNQSKEVISKIVNPVTSEFQNIYNHLPSGSKVYVDGDRDQIAIAKHAINYYLAGSYFTSLKMADFVISENPDIKGEKLTSNDTVNLYRITNGE